MNKVQFSEFGGVNANDQQERLMRRLQMMGMVESPGSVNGEFYQEGYGRRKGHSAHEFTAAIGNALIAGDSAIAVQTLMRFDQSRRITVAVGKKAIYANPVNSASFHALQRIKHYSKNTTVARTESTRYEHLVQATVADMQEFEGHLFIAAGEGNPIQVYTSAFTPRDAFFGPASGTATSGVTLSAYVLDWPMASRVSASASLEAPNSLLVSTSAISRYVPHSIIALRSGNAPYATIKAVSTASSKITLDFGYGEFSDTAVVNLADSINKFSEFYRESDESYSATAQRITGAWGVGYKQLVRLHDRILYSRGDNLIEYTPSYYTTNSGVWDASAGGFFIAPSPIVAMTQFVPDGGGDMNAHIYMFTENGVTSRPGMSDFDEVVENNGTGAALNKDCVTQIENWLVYLTRTKQLRAVNGRMDIDLGRRLKNKDGTSGPLDAMDVATSKITAFLFYDAKKKKLYAHFSSATGLVNDRQVVLDFDLGEPIVGEPLESYETRVRCLDWRIDSPTANEGFICMTNIGDDAIGVRKNGTLWKINDGDTDFTAGTIQWSWYTPQLTLGDPTRNKTWMNTRVATMNQGSHSAVLSKRINRQTTDTDLLTFEQSAVDGIVMRSAQLDEDKFAMQIGIRNENAVASEPTILTGVSVEYTVDAQEW
jgi:hypothetical protein